MGRAELGAGGHQLRPECATLLRVEPRWLASLAGAASSAEWSAVVLHERRQDDEESAKDDDEVEERPSQRCRRRRGHFEAIEENVALEEQGQGLVEELVGQPGGQEETQVRG